MLLHLASHIFAFAMFKTRKDKIFFSHTILFLWKHISTACIDVNCIHHKIYNTCIYITKYCVISTLLTLTTQYALKTATCCIKILISVVCVFVFNFFYNAME